MCAVVPVLAGVAAAGIVGGTIVGAHAANKAAKAAKGAANAQADLLELEAGDIIEVGKADAAMVRMQGTAAIGAGRARMAAGNVELEGGTALEVLAQTRQLSEWDASKVRTNAAREAWSKKKTAKMVRKTGQQAAAQGRLAVASTLISGIGNVAAIGASYFGGGAGTGSKGAWV